MANACRGGGGEPASFFHVVPSNSQASEFTCPRAADPPKAMKRPRFESNTKPGSAAVDEGCGGSDFQTPLSSDRTKPTASLPLYPPKERMRPRSSAAMAVPD